MMKRTAGTALRRWLLAGCAGALVVGLAACAPAANSVSGSVENRALDVRMPAENENGIITAESWATVYPNEYATYLSNSENKDGKEVSEDFPELAVLWEGASYADFYHEPNGHTYALKDISETGRDPQLAGCLTCKSSEFILKQNEDPSLNKSSFDDMLAQVDEPISCYDCHENSPKDNGPVAIRQFFIDNVGDAAASLPEGAMSCGQCHNEYFFPGENKAADNPWGSLAEATPDAILATHNEMGYVDHTNPSTGAKMIKVQHPEFETVYGGEMNKMAQLGYSCSDCHMAVETDENGTEYTSHYWGSPLDNEELIANDCSQCHKDIKAEVEQKQEKTVEREHAIAARIETLIETIKAAREANALSEDELAQVQDLHRTAQFYWEFVKVENSDGAHNQALATDSLDKSEAAIDEAMSILA